MATQRAEMVPRGRAALDGVLATGAGLGAGHLVALLAPASSPVVAVATRAIDLTPGPVKDWAVSTFGTADKAVLVVGAIAVTLGLGALVGLVADGVISGSAAKQVFALMAEERAEPQEIVERHGLGQISDEGALDAVVARVVADNPAQADQFRAGKEQLLGYFVGLVMKATQGRANPKLANDLVRKALGK